jgi:antitoxin component of MazEF toxin-antitoxin module
MGAIKLTKIGNSQGFTIPKEILEKSDFSIGDSLEAHIHNGRLILFKKPLHHSEMKFEGPQSKEELEWADADLGEWDDNK